MMPVNLYLDRPEDTERLGSRLARLYIDQITNEEDKKPIIILLDSENLLGAGKSVLASGFIRSLTGEEYIQSPSYLYSLSYEVDLAQIKNDDSYNCVTIDHIDTWRMKQTQSLTDILSVDNIIKDRHILVIEHSARAQDMIDLLDQKAIIRITIRSGDSGLTGLGRNVTIETGEDCLYDISKLNDESTLVPFVTEPSAGASDDMILVDTDTIPILEKIRAKDRSDILIMGIETSCDDTCVAILSGDGRIIYNAKIGQTDVHEQYGGVNPGEARKSHAEAIDKCVDGAFDVLKEVYGEDRVPDAIAFTIGPGLEVCLAVGVTKAYEISYKYQIPLIPTNHLESHIVICRLPSLVETFGTEIKYPFIAAVVSGGHTFIALAKSPGSYRLLASTSNDSIGETGDKIGRMIGITAVPAGPELEKLALNGEVERFRQAEIGDEMFREPPLRQRDGILWMSFSNYKQWCNTTISRYDSDGLIGDHSKEVAKGMVQIPREMAADVAHIYQESVTTYFVRSLRRVLGELGEDYTRIVIAGGFAANQVFRAKLDALEKELGMGRGIMVYPPIDLCTDNAVMVAQNGFEKLDTGFIELPRSSIDLEEKYEVRSRWPLTH
jgi:N6-L-threonylcarbamoyladenine synthase